MNFIPRIEFNDITITGTITLGSAVISSVPITTNIVTGMITKHPSFGSSRVVSKTSNSVTMDTVALSNFTGSIAFYETIDFIYPPEGRPSESYDPINTVSTSLSGTRQVSTTGILGLLDLNFSFLDKDLFAKLRDRFYLRWAIYGQEFRFFESNDETEFNISELNRLELSPRKIVPKQGDFIYSARMSIRRVL